MNELLMQENRLIDVLRHAVLAVFIFAVIGTGSELVLLEHTEDVWMWIPLALMALSMLNVIACLVARKPGLLQVFKGLMYLFILSGFVGTWMHYKGNMEFELEMYPAMKGVELFWESMKGATPALAPGTMVQFGLLGLIYAFKHPVLTKE